MLNFKKEKVNIDEKLKQRIDFICKFCGLKPTFESGNIISLDKTNLYYIEPNKAIIKDILILFFNYSNEVYINNLNNKVLLKNLLILYKFKLKLSFIDFSKL